METNPRTQDPAKIEFDSFGLPDVPDDEFDQMFQDFIDSITVSDEELHALVAIPEASVSDVRRIFAVRPGCPQ